MLTKAVLGSFTLAAALSAFAPNANQPEFTAEGRLQFPSSYREWVYLSSGFDMTYRARTQAPAHSQFDNVFVNPEAYRAYRASGTWPDSTMFVLEVRPAAREGSINQGGAYQSDAAPEVEMHVKDGRGPEGKWSFYGFGSGTNPAKRIAQSANCYGCHQEHGAVDTTFVQFYPTLLATAKAKGTLKKD